MLVADKCDHCGATGWADMHDFKSCNECASTTCKDCATYWEDETNSTVCNRCASEARKEAYEKAEHAFTKDWPASKKVIA